MLAAKFKTFTLLLLLILTAGSVARSQVHSASEPIEIRGQVRFSQGGAPVDNIVVRLEAVSGGFIGEDRTDRLGKFRFSGLSPIQYFVYVRYPGYREVRREVNLIMQASDYVQIQLIPEDPASAATAPATKLLDANVPAEARKEFEKGEAALISQKRVDEGIRHLEKAVSIYPKFLEAQLRLGAAYMDAKEWDKAEQALRRALEINPKTANALFALGELYLQQKQYDEAEKILRQGLRIEDHSWQGHFTLGRVYWDKHDIPQAGKQVALALQLNPNLADAHLLAGNILLRARKLEDAQVEFEEYLRLSPKGEFAAQARDAVQKLKSSASQKK